MSPMEFDHYMVKMCNLVQATTKTLFRSRIFAFEKDASGRPCVSSLLTPPAHFKHHTLPLSHLDLSISNSAFTSLFFKFRAHTFSAAT